MQIVADMTGYPPELLDLDLDLEADLGVDTVKQAEVFAAVRAQFGIPRDENLQLRDFPTLAHVIGFARDRGTTGVAAAVPAPQAPVPQAPARRHRHSPPPRHRRLSRHPPRHRPDADPVTAQIVQIVADMTGYPSELLDLDLDLEADLGVDTVKQAEVFAAVRAQFGIPRDENLQLRDFPTLAHVIGFARDRGTTGVAAPAATGAGRSGRRWASGRSTPGCSPCRARVHR